MRGSARTDAGTGQRDQNGSSGDSIDNYRHDKLLVTDYRMQLVDTVRSTGWHGGEKTPARLIYTFARAGELGLMGGTCVVFAKVPPVHPGQFVERRHRLFERVHGVCDVILARSRALISLQDK